MTELTDQATRNQVFLERLKAGEHAKFAPYLRQINRLVRDRLNDEGDTIETKAALNALLRDIKAGQVSIYAEYNAQLIDLLEELSIDQTSFEVDALKLATKEASIISPTNKSVHAALYNNIMQMQNYNGDQLLVPFIRDLTDNQVNMVQNTIRTGYSQGRTTDQIARDIRGTKNVNYSNGKLAQVNRSNRALVMTTLQHASTQGRMATLKKNEDVLDGYEWVSTLDSHTTQICRSLDGQVFEIGEGPLPPIHINCRSTIVAAVNPEFSLIGGGTRPSVGAKGAKTVSAGTTYYDWLGRQPAAFQDSAIGVTRGKLFRNGGLTNDEFAALNIGKNFEPLTLDEMRARRPEVFESANI